MSRFKSAQPERHTLLGEVERSRTESSSLDASSAEAAPSPNGSQPNEAQVDWSSTNLATLTTQALVLPVQLDSKKTLVNGTGEAAEQARAASTVKEW